jgi:methylmalonyl-CoA/ethylmalonyl-CoA epimerase
MLRIKKIDHVAVCVSDIDEAAPAWRALLAGLLGSGATEVREVVPSQKTDALVLPAGEACVELIAPRGNEGLERFLAKRGSGLHHLAFEVEDIEAALEALRASGARLIDEVPRIGARGHKVAFVHPSAFGGVLVELVEHTTDAQS